MSLIKDYGDPNNPCWVVLTQPYAKDVDGGFILSGGYGYNFKKTWKLGNAPDPYITALNMDLSFDFDMATMFPLFLARLVKYQPKLIVPLGDELLPQFCPQTKPRDKKASALYKWAGSLLHSPHISWPHYVMGTYTPDFISNNWDLHEVQGYIDFGRVRGELDYLRQYGVLEPLPSRSVITEPTYDTTCDYLRYLIDSYINKRIRYASSDIETLRPKKGSYYNDNGHSGYMYTISLAPSIKEAISFCLWDYPIEQALKIWRLLNRVLSEVPQIGQNYFVFDSHHMEALGYKVCLPLCSDTLIRHHILWPGLPHKLQFQTRQYTREPYYKDEGKNWTVKQKHQLMRYNCLDSMVTYEIWLAQEEEFDARPYLR